MRSLFLSIHCRILLQHSYRMATSNASIRSVNKFRGCLVGSHIGDCFGAPFEGDFPVSPSVLSKYVQSWLEDATQRTMKQPYTDDTAMTLCIANSLVDNNGFNAKDMAKRFVEEFKNDPKRGYGTHVIDVFAALDRSDYSDVYEPAKQQFNGSGSYGNGAAMRIAPVALFKFGKEQELIQVAKESSLITHAHQNGYNGAILQCLAISQALSTKSDAEINPVSFVNSLLEKFDELEKPLNVSSLEDSKPYCTSLQKIRDVFEESKQVSPDDIAELLGNTVAAHKSVPTAIYSFLKGLRPSDDFTADNPFVRTIHAAVSVGGDTDTIAAMAGSISGAYYGIEMIPESFKVRCEAIEQSDEAASKLFKLFSSD